LRRTQEGNPNIHAIALFTYTIYLSGTNHNYLLVTWAKNPLHPSMETVHSRGRAGTINLASVASRGKTMA